MARDRLRFPFTRVTPPTYSPPCTWAHQRPICAFLQAHLDQGVQLRTYLWVASAYDTESHAVQQLLAWLQNATFAAESAHTHTIKNKPLHRTCSNEHWAFHCSSVSSRNLQLKHSSTRNMMCRYDVTCLLLEREQHLAHKAASIGDALLFVGRGWLMVRRQGHRLTATPQHSPGVSRVAHKQLTRLQHCHHCGAPHLRSQPQAFCSATTRARSSRLWCRCQVNHTHCTGGGE